MLSPKTTFGLLVLAIPALAIPTLDTSLVVRQSTPVDSCPGYSVKNAKTGKGYLKANLVLAGAACNAYGPDVSNLSLEVTYEEGSVAFGFFCLFMEL